MGPFFIQFPHPGGEGGPDRSGWAKAGEAHVRKFMRAAGRFRRSAEGPDEVGEIGFWAEWEADSVCVQTPDGLGGGYPAFVHRPLPPDRERQPRLPQNTDPFVFAGAFLYTFCRQDRYRALKSLDRGSVIVFGSKLHGAFVCDTVFVVAKAIQHTGRTWRERLADFVPAVFLETTIGPMYAAMTRRDHPYTLYFGATPETAVDGTFSFFPCLPIAEGANGFGRPALRDLRGINPRNAQGVAFNKGIPHQEFPTCWRAVVERVHDAGCYLGIEAALSAENSVLSTTGAASCE